MLAGARMTARVTGVFNGRCSSDFFLPDRAEHRGRELAEPRTPPSSAPRLDRPRAVRPARPAARWTDPDATTTRLLRSRTAETARRAAAAPTSAVSSAPLAEAAPLRPLIAVAACLSPARGSRRRTTRRTSRCVRARSCSCSLELRRSTRRRSRPASCEQPSVDRSGHRAGGRPCFESTNFDAFSSLIESRRPTLIWPGSNAVSAPGRPLAAQ